MDCTDFGFDVIFIADEKLNAAKFKSDYENQRPQHSPRKSHQPQERSRQ
jgi:hypothetical protein